VRFCDRRRSSLPLREEGASVRESYFCIYVIESRSAGKRNFYPWVKEGFLLKREALERCKELREKFAHRGREFRVTDYWDKRPW
jgi:hypothetical protein